MRSIYNTHVYIILADSIKDELSIDSTLNREYLNLLQTRDVHHSASNKVSVNSRYTYTWDCYTSAFNYLHKTQRDIIERVNKASPSIDTCLLFNISVCYIDVHVYIPKNEHYQHTDQDISKNQACVFIVYRL